MSDSKSSSSANSGIGFAGMLTILFIGLKLTHNIDWPWVWVLSPLWIGLALGLLIILTILFFALLVSVFKAIFG